VTSSFGTILARRLVLAAGVLTLAGARPAPAAEERLVVALKPDKNPEQMARERKVLASYLQEALARPVEVIVPLSAAVILTGLGGGSIDLAYLSATDMLAARKDGAAEVLLAGEIKGQPSYKSYWLALADKPYRTVEDLKGQAIAFASRTSTSGYLVPHADLVRRKLIAPGAPPETYFGEGHVFYGTGYVSAVEKVLSGEAEAAAVSDYVFDGDKHLTPEQRARLRKVAEQGPVPSHVLAVRKSLDGAVKTRLRAALLALNDAKWQSLRDQLFTSKLVEVEEAAHLASLAEALRLTGKEKD
jgi:phosphonate transport system substrate-binding protein